MHGHVSRTCTLYLFSENSLCDCVCIGDVRLEQHEEELGHVGHRALVLDERVREQVIVVLVLVLQDEHCLRRIEDHSSLVTEPPQAPALLQGSGGRS